MSFKEKKMKILHENIQSTFFFSLSKKISLGYFSKMRNRFSKYFPTAERFMKTRTKIKASCFSNTNITKKKFQKYV